MHSTIQAILNLKSFAVVGVSRNPDKYGYKVYKSLKVWLIEVGQDVVCLTIAGAILGAWS